MSFHQMMHPRQRAQFQAVGEFLYIESCPASVSITTERGEYRLKPGAQIIDPQLSGRVTVENMGEAGAVTILCGFGRYIPPADGQQVAVTQMPEMVLAPEQQVEVAKLPAVALVDGQQVIVSQLPKVQLDDNQQVTVSQIPELSLAAGQQVAITALPKVQFETGQAVRVYATNPLLTKPVGGSGIGTSLLTIETSAATLAENPSRCHVLMKVPSANTQPITLGNGWELAPGEQLKLETTAELVFAGTDGDTIQIIEVIR
ncbi:hypothetical protein MD588_18940 [Photobacterium sp. SDRW27]|uniref:hypothetical protein n=1 Tax=Photobacterium obscurum TaxID=2829490 RepID=UPI0022448DDD|nr:hypothetical protein [Photobacterium obscurum]MCW8330873.1 hypothetical protein [Photobacterium obscurum]